MGGLTYLFGFVFNAVIATGIAGIAAIIAIAVPLRRPVEQDYDAHVRKTRAKIAFTVVWFGIMLYGCVAMFQPHWRELDKSDAAGMGNGMLASAADVEQATALSYGETARTYARVRTTVEDVQRLATEASFEPSDFDAHSVQARERFVPDWWPKTACAGGVTYRAKYGVDSIATPSPWQDLTVNWCPHEQRAYLQREDY